jgi:hypothetical protein
MNDAEARLRAAEHKAAALHNLGWETGAGATIWARAISDLLERHEAARDRMGQQIALEEWERLHSNALLPEHPYLTQSRNGRVLVRMQPP